MSPYYPGVTKKQTKVEDDIIEGTWAMESDKTYGFKIFSRILLIHKMSMMVTPDSWGYW